MSLELANPDQCTHLNAAGRRCRMNIAPTHETLCAHHVQLHIASQPDPETLAAELLDGTGNLNTADRVNVLLGNLVKQLAHKRINRQDAVAIGYLAQLLLSSVPEIQKEYQAIRAAKAREAYRKSAAESQPRLRATQTGFVSNAPRATQVSFRPSGCASTQPAAEESASELRS